MLQCFLRYRVTVSEDLRRRAQGWWEVAIDVGIMVAFSCGYRGGLGFAKVTTLLGPTDEGAVPLRSKTCQSHATRVT